MKPEEKSTFVYITFYTLFENLLPCKAMLIRYQLINTFFMLLLVSRGAARIFLRGGLKLWKQKP